MIRQLYFDPLMQIVEHSPTKRTIHIENRRYFLPFPYMVFAISYFKRPKTEQGSWIFSALGSLKPVKSSADYLFTLPLPNSYPNGTICMGDRSIDPLLGIKHYVERYFASVFNDGVPEATAAWKIQKEIWTPFSNPLTMKWKHQGQQTLAQFLPWNHNLPNILSDDFNDDKIRALAEQLRQNAHGYTDEDVWLAAEDFLIRKEYRKPLSPFR